MPTISTTEPLVSIITVNYNQTALTGELLHSIRRNSYRNIEVFVVDNASVESPAEFILQNFPDVKFIQSTKNLGFAGGNNLAIPQAKGEYLFFVNNDAELTNGCIEKLLLMFRKVPKLGAVSPLLCYFNDPNEHLSDLVQYAGATRVHPITARNKIIGNKVPDKGQFNTAQPTDYIHGAAMMLPRKVIDRVGTMHKDFFLYYEELDWSERIKKAGYEIWVEPTTRIYHKESVSTGGFSPMKMYYLNRNRIYFMRRNYRAMSLIPFWLFLFSVTVPINTLRHFVVGELQHISALYRAVWWNFKN